MDSDSPTALHKRLVELLRASGHNTLHVAQIAAILGVDPADESRYNVLRKLLAQSRVVDYDVAAQTVRSTLRTRGEEADEDEAALLALSDVDGRHQHSLHGSNYHRGSTPQLRAHQRRSNSRHAPHSRTGATTTTIGAGYRSDTGFYNNNTGSLSNNRSFTGAPSRRRAPGGWSKPSQRALDDAASYPGPVGRVGYVCVADELHLGKLEAYYHAQGYYTKFDFDVLHVRFAQPPTTGTVRVEADAAGAAASSGSPYRDNGRGREAAATAAAGGGVRRAAPNNNNNNNNNSTGYNTGDDSLPRQEEEEEERRGRRSPHRRVSPPPPPPLATEAASGTPGMRTAADTSPSHRDYGTTRILKTAVVTASGVEGGEAPAAAAGGSAANSNNNNSNNGTVKHGFDLFIFPYGAVVWWGFDQRYFKIVENDYMLPHSAISHCMTNRYTTQLVNENYPVWCTYNLVRRDTLEVDDDFKARLRFDHFVIPYSRGEVATGSVLMLCASHALAQSAKIDYIELQVQELADSCSPLPRELREKGTVSITERRLLQLRGEVLSYRLMLKSGSDLLDEPDFFWENAYLKPVFQATKEEFEIAERVEALDNKLDAANEILSMLAEDFSQRHGARLEWIVIWLVFVEVVIGVLELLVDIRPWIRAK